MQNRGARSGTRDGGHGYVKTATQGREIGDTGYIAEKQKKVAMDRSKKLISSNQKWCKHRHYGLVAHETR